MNNKEIIVDKLKAMGFDPVDLGSAGYVFQYGEMNFLYMPDEDDQFLRIALPNVKEVTDDNRAAILEAAHETGLQVKYAKVNIMFEDNVWCVYEHYLNSIYNLSELLEHIIRVLEVTAMVFYKKLNGEELEIGEGGEPDENSDNLLEEEMRKMFECIEE